MDSIKLMSLLQTEKSAVTKIVIPAPFWSKILNLVHDNPHASHLQHFFWQGYSGILCTIVKPVNTIAPYLISVVIEPLEWV